MKLCQVVVHMGSYNFNKFHHKRMKQKSFINSLFFCSEFQRVSRIVKIVHSASASNSSGFSKCFQRLQTKVTYMYLFAKVILTIVVLPFIMSYGTNKVSTYIKYKTNYLEYVLQNNFSRTSTGNFGVESGQIGQKLTFFDRSQTQSKT